MQDRVALALPDGARIVVPRALHLITPYVLEEQGDWFEQDIHFVRRLLQPGDQVVDIGANHGVYTLSMARAVGAGGRVWAFEPGKDVRRFLQESVDLNEYAHVKVLAQALSNREGQAWLSSSGHSELGTLAEGPAAAREPVSLTTLDRAMDAEGWPELAFMKVDAEGEEANILQGGQRFFSERSPLVMFEVRADGKFSIELVDQFAALGYHAYKLVPEPGLLVPFQRGDALDAFALNLYACKPERAASLAAAGRLVVDDAQESAAAAAAAADLGDGTAAAQALYARSQDPQRRPVQRWADLQRSLALFNGAAGQAPTPAVLASLARVAAAAGERVAALTALTSLLQAWAGPESLAAAGPYLQPWPRFDERPAGVDAAVWFLAAVLEAHERLSAHSSFYAGRPALQRLEMIHRLGHGSPEMQRRLRLMRMRFPATGAV